MKYVNYPYGSIDLGFELFTYIKSHIDILWNLYRHISMAATKSTNGPPYIIAPHSRLSSPDCVTIYLEKIIDDHMFIAVVMNRGAYTIAHFLIKVTMTDNRIILITNDIPGPWRSYFRIINNTIYVGGDTYNRILDYIGTVID